MSTRFKNWSSLISTFCISYAVQIFQVHFRLVNRLSDNLQCPRFMMLCGVAGEEPLARWGHVGVTNIGEDLDDLDVTTICGFGWGV